jgi:hypothetical protein
VLRHGLLVSDRITPSQCYNLSGVPINALHAHITLPRWHRQPTAGRQDDRKGTWSPAQVYAGAHPHVKFFPHIRRGMHVVFMDGEEYYQWVEVPNDGEDPRTWGIRTSLVQKMLEAATKSNSNFRRLSSHPFSTLLKGRLSVTASVHTSGDDPLPHITITPLDSNLFEKIDGQIHLRVYKCDGCGQVKQHFAWDGTNIHLYEMTFRTRMPRRAAGRHN